MELLIFIRFPFCKFLFQNNARISSDDDAKLKIKANPFKAILYKNDLNLTFNYQYDEQIRIFATTPTLFSNQVKDIWLGTRFAKNQFIAKGLYQPKTQNIKIKALLTQNLNQDYQLQMMLKSIIQNSIADPQLVFSIENSNSLLQLMCESSKQIMRFFNKIDQQKLLAFQLERFEKNFNIKFGLQYDLDEKNQFYAKINHQNTLTLGLRMIIQNKIQISLENQVIQVQIDQFPIQVRININ
ncbi:hypothetical protein pb186bvf_007004 [Paramecium bursaria]